MASNRYWVNRVTINQWEYITNRRYRIVYSLKTSSGGSPSFSSGYTANLALFSCLLTRNDTYIIDEFVHRSIVDGCQLSQATKWKFRHNDLQHLEQLLSRTKGNVIVVVESLYSVDGDFAPLGELVNLTQRFNAELIVDESHSIGVFGNGILAQKRLYNQVLAYTISYGKAMGVHGGVVLGSSILKTYLINFASPFIFATAPPLGQVIAIKAAYCYLENHPELMLKLHQNIQFFRSFNIHALSEDGSPIQLIQIPCPESVLALTSTLAKKGITVYPLFSPTVPKGKERIRVCLHSFNLQEEITLLCNTVKNYEYIT